MHLCSFAGNLFVEASWNMTAHAQKPELVFWRNGRVHLNRRGRQFSRLLAAELCASAVVILDTPCSEVVWRVLATHSIRQFPLHFPSRASPCAITFQLESNTECLSPALANRVYTPPPLQAHHTRTHTRHSLLLVSSRFLIQSAPSYFLFRCWQALKNVKK